MTSTGHDLGSVEEFESGKPYTVEIGRKKLVLVRNGETFYAIRDVCPHAGAQLSKGQVTGMAWANKPGQAVEYRCEGDIIACPWHGWEFELKTGRSVTRPERLRVRTYAVRVESGRVVMEL